MGPATPLPSPCSAAAGNYQLSISLEIKNGFTRSRKGAKYWTGMIESNVLEGELTK
jgi:hypothetical protein